MAASINFPASLPCPLHSGYELQHVSPLERTELVTGRARQRRRYTSVPTMASVEWLFDEPQAMIFEAWFKYTIKDGAEWFNCRLLSPIGAKDYECRFVEMYDGPSLTGRRLWKISAELEIRERPTIPAEWEPYIEIYAYRVIFDIAMNREWPEV